MIAAKLGWIPTLPLVQIFVIFGHFPSDLEAVLLCSDCISSICCVVVDFLQIVELLWICYGFVVQLVMELL